MGKLASRTNTPPLTESDQVFESAAELFRAMSAPMRLKIISSLCNGEKNVSQLLAKFDIKMDFCITPIKIYKF